MVDSSSDRFAKYLWGSARLAGILALSLALDASSQPGPGRPAPLSRRCLAPCYLGASGALINTRAVGPAASLALLLLGAALVVHDAALLSRDLLLPLVVLKTFAGDLLAGKIDTREWRWAVALTALVAGGWLALSPDWLTPLAPFWRILPLVTFVQVGRPPLHPSLHPLAMPPYRWRRGARRPRRAPAAPG
jgi:hypothetical protein